MDLIGCVKSARTSWPIKLTIKIITNFPDKTAKINCQIFIFESPATTLIAAEGVNGKHKMRNNGLNPLRSIHVNSFFIALFSRKRWKNFNCPSFLMIINTIIAPKHAPIQDKKNPSQNPNEFTLATMNTTSGKNGKNASINGNNIAKNGPNER